MIDTHAHINTDKFAEDRQEVIQRALDSGVENIIIPAIEPKDFDSLLNLVHENEQLYCGIGIHPHNVAEIGDTEIDRVRELSTKDKVVAIGEIGIDYYYDFCPKDKQKESFDKQISIALEKDLPIIVHNREADKDVLDIIEKNQDGNLRGVLHCFSSGLDTLKRTLDLGMNVSFTGNITFKKSTLDDVVEYVPLDRVMIETDSPYITPVPYRGKRNEPSYVKHVAEKMAEIKKKSFEEIVEMTTKNAKELFKIPLILLMILGIHNTVLAQDEEEFDDYYDDEEYYDDSLYVDEWEGYNKRLGIGALMGINTIVTIRDDNNEISDDGLLGFGGELSFYPVDFLFIKGTYILSFNDRLAEDLKLRGVPSSELPEPGSHQLIELTLAATPNPSSVINFYGMFGFSFITNTSQIINENDIGFQKFTENRTAINYGVGVMGNYQLGNAGTITLSGEVKFNYELGKQEALLWVGLDNQTGENIFETFNIYRIFSIPRFSITYYPNFGF